MTDIDLSSYKALYLQTARQYVSDIRQAVEALKLNPSDDSAITKIYISAHSLKSQSIMMGFTQIGQVCMLIEAKFKPLREQQSTVSPAIIAALNDTVTVATVTMDSIEKDNKEQDLSSIISTWGQL